MSIPSYDEIYSFPGGYLRPPHGCSPHMPLDKHHKPHFEPSYARETSKSIDIYDKFGRLRYVVELASQLLSPGQRGYKVTVAQMLQNGLKAFLQIPSDGSYEPKYDIAIENFNACVKKYQSLIDAEMRDFRDIDVYSENIGYEVQKVECCSSCRWCMKTLAKGKHTPKHENVIKMQCCCPMNEQVFNYAQQFPQMPHNRFHDHGWKQLPWQAMMDQDGLDGASKEFQASWDPRKFPNIVFPTVDPLGKCENYTHGDGYLQYGLPHTPPQYQIASNIATAFDPTVEYKPGDLVYYAGKLYQCINEHPAGNWNDNDFVVTTINDALKQKTPIEMLSDYVQTTALSGYEISEDPRQREIADAVKHLLSALGGCTST